MTEIKEKLAGHQIDISLQSMGRVDGQETEICTWGCTEGACTTGAFVCAASVLSEEYQAHSTLAVANEVVSGKTWKKHLFMPVVVYDVTRYHQPTVRQYLPKKP
jgi:hypothetical protein